jgi:CHAD domain-containing protein
MPLERELKFEAGKDFALPDLTALVPGARIQAMPARTLEAVYFDTADLRLARWGVTLRHRPEDGVSRWTVKLAAAEDRPGLRARHEINFDASKGKPARTPPPDALDLVTAYARGEALAPVARLVTRRMPFALEADDGRVLAEVDDDEVTAYRGKQVAARFREIEVELGPAAGDRLVKAVQKRFRQAGGTRSARPVKLLHAVSPDGPLAAEVAPPSVTARATTADLVGAAIAAGVRRLLVHDPLVRLDLDIEAVHQARVATRRLRSDLHTFAAFLDPAWLEQVGEGLASLGRTLGAVRDADVLGERLNAAIERLPDPDRRPAAKLLAVLAGQREASRAALLAELRSDGYRALLDRLVAAAQAPPLANGEAPVRAGPAVAAVVADRWKAVRKRAARSGEGDAALHAVRIAAKRCRYAAEAGRPVLGKKGAALAAAMADVQTVLGDHQDAVVAQHWLRQTAATPRLGAAAALAAGQLIAAEEAEAATAVGRFPAAWRSARAAGRAFATSA